MNNSFRYEITFLIIILDYSKYCELFTFLPTLLLSLKKKKKSISFIKKKTFRFFSFKSF